MSTTLTLNAVKYALVQSTEPDYNDHTSNVLTKPYSGPYNAFFGFEPLPKAYWNRRIYHVALKAYIPPDAGGAFYAISREWDEQEVTWLNRPGSPTGVSTYIIISNSAASYDYSDYSNAKSDFSLSKGIIYGVCTDDADFIGMHTSHSANPPQWEIQFLDDYQYLEIQSTSPAEGARIDRRKELTISFTATRMNTGYPCAYLPWFEQCTLYWRRRGDATWNKVGQASSVGYDSGQFTIPANTFPAGDIEYSIKTVDSTAHISTSQTVTIDTTDTISSAICKSPISTLVNGAERAEFTWQHINESGTLPTKSELQFTQTQDNWSQTVTVNGSGLTYEAAPGSFTSGTWYWRVRTYNQDNVAGSWSNAAEFIVVAPPSTPTILILDASPRPEIQWQTSEQEGYQVQLEGIYDQILFGPGKTWKCPQYLDDGAYTVRVRAQNRYGLWSPWGEAAIVISNTAGPTIQLSVQFGHIAALSWTGQGYDFYLVYRDGKPIARLTDTEYIDEYSGGQVAYFIRGGYTGSGNYGSSNVVDGSISVDMTMIKAIPDGQWIQLPYSTSMYANDSTTRRRDASRQKLQGRAYPVAELGEFLERSTSFSCAFFHQDDPGLQQLLGRTVCAKAPGQEVIIGTLDSLRSTHSTFYVSYAFDLSQEYFEEEIDIDTGNILSS